MPLSIFEVVLISDKGEELVRTNACLDNLIERLYKISQTQKEKIYIFSKNNGYAKHVLNKIKTETNFDVVIMGSVVK